MLNYSRSVFSNSTWGMHINSARTPNYHPPYPNWLNPYQQKEWQDRGFVVWDGPNKIVARVYARCALKILETLKRNDNWRTSSFIVASPAYQISLPNTRKKRQLKKQASNLLKRDGY